MAKLTKKYMERTKPNQETKRQPLPPEKFPENNRAVFADITRRSELDPANPEYIKLSPITLRALEIYTTEISLIPRGPHNKEGMIHYFSDYTEKFNEDPEHKQKLTFAVDDPEKGGNVLLRLAAHGGQKYEQLPEIDFQGHYDMVSASKDGFPSPAEFGVALQLQTVPNNKTGKNDAWMSAINTSAGIDCAWGVSFAMAQLEDISKRNTNHPAVGLIATSDEEVGLLGAKAFAFTKDQLTGGIEQPQERYLFNIDSDKLDGIVGDAGLSGGDIVLATDREALPDGMSRMGLAVLGSRGGHSGEERDRIGNGRWNKITVAAEMIGALKKQPGFEDVRLIALEGGEADNAIPMEVRTVVLAVPQGREEDVAALLQHMAEEKNQQAVIDLARFTKENPEKAEDDAADAVAVKLVEESEKIQSINPMTAQATDHVLELIEALSQPDGILKIDWNPNDPTAIETSANLSLAATNHDGISLTILTRSSQVAQLRGENSRPERIKAFAEQMGATLVKNPNQSGDPWQPDFTDPLVMLQQETAREVLSPDKKFKITTIHAGVEVNTLRGKFWEIFGPDYIFHGTSNGPTYKDPHSFNERGLLQTMEDFSIFESALFEKVIAYELQKRETERNRRAI